MKICEVFCNIQYIIQYNAPWLRVRVPVLLNLGTMFDPPCVLRAILNTLAPVGSGVSVITHFQSDYQGSLKGHYALNFLLSTCAW